MAAGHDPSLVGRSNEEALRRFRARRAAGDEAAARLAWEALVEQEHDRIVALVRIWGRGGRLSRDEQQEAVQLATVKMWHKMVDSFRGTSMGELVNAVRACVEFACLDVQRNAARHASRTAWLDEPGDDEEGARGRWDDELADVLARQHDRSLERSEAADFVAWALPKIEDDRQRRVAQWTLEGVDAADIAAQLDVSMANLYQLRSRGLKALAKLKEQWDA